jgi:hypothetical protein
VIVMRRLEDRLPGFVAAAVLIIAWPPTIQAGFQITAPATTAPAPAELEGMLTRLASGAKEYQKVFANLIADETKVVERFDESGRVDKRREIVSDLAVYTARGASGTEEYRDVRSVDGKPVEKRSGRALEVLTRAAQSASIKKELEVINRESLRYDLDYNFTGGTVNQPAGLVFVEREKRRVDWVGRDRIGGHDVLVLDFRDTTPSRIHGNPEFYAAGGFSSSIVRGRVWIDAATSALRRGRWEVAGIHPALPEPVTVVRHEATYTESRFGILVPERSTFEFYARAKPAKNQPPSYFMRARATCTYGVFRKFEVETQETIGAPAPPQR